MGWESIARMENENVRFKEKIIYIYILPSDNETTFHSIISEWTEMEKMS